MAIPGDGFISVAEPADFVNRDLPSPFEATYRDGGNGTFESSDPMDHTDLLLGEAAGDVDYGLDTAGDPMLLVTLRRTAAYGGVLMDSFQASPSVPTMSEIEGLFFGESGGNILFEFGEDWQDNLEDITARVLTVPVAPGGAGGEALFHNLYLAMEWQSGASVTVTPILDGRRVTSLQRTFELVGAANPQRDRFELPLSEPFEVGGVEELRSALRGTWFQVQIEVVASEATEGSVVLEGVELEREIVRESHPGVDYTVEDLDAVATARPSLWFMGAGGAVLEGDTGTDDDGTAISARIETAHVAPAGPGGEAVFHNLYLAVTRANAEDLELNVTPIVDGQEQELEVVTLEGVVDPVTEVLEIPVMQAHTGSGATELLRYAPRGTWVGVRIDVDAPGDALILEGLELEQEVVREGEDPVDA